MRIYVPPRVLLPANTLVLALFCPDTMTQLYLCSPTESCYLPSVVGPCTGSVPSWYHDAETKQCKSFIYGGCLGNNNRYASREECEERCVIPEKTGTSRFCVYVNYLPSEHVGG